jgi:hypothetical protein
MKSVPRSSQNTVEFTASLPFSQHSQQPCQSKSGGTSTGRDNILDDSEDRPDEKTKSGYEQATIGTAKLYIIGKPTTNQGSRQATAQQYRTSGDTGFTYSQAERAYKVRGEPERSATDGEKAKN